MRWLLPVVVVGLALVGSVAFWLRGSHAPSPVEPPSAVQTGQVVHTEGAAPRADPPPAGDAPPAPSPAPVAEAGATGFPVVVELPKQQRVTVVIEDAQGNRVRNLIGETLLPAGRNQISWDGYDDGGEPDKDGAVVRHKVKPGTYAARGLSHDGLKTIFEFPLYSGGDPPWTTEAKNGGWLADHAPPAGAVFLASGSPYGGGQPQILFNAMVSETGRNLVWVSLDGKVLHRDTYWGWDAGMCAAADTGPKRDSRYYAFMAMCWGKKDADVIVRGLSGESGVEIARFKTKTEMEESPRHVGIEMAVRDGLAAVTVPLDDLVMFVEVKTGKVLGPAAMKAPKGVAFDQQGRLLVSSAGAVRRFDVDRKDANAAPRLLNETILAKGLEDPRSIAFDPGFTQMFVADWGKSSQVKVFTPDGKPVRVIGKPGGYQIGAYDELRMHLPHGLAPDDRGQLWIAEADWLPKRISLWDAKTGGLKRAWYGPPHYGGGGTLDPEDKTRFFYGEFGGTMEFKLDYEKGTSTLVGIPIRWWDVPHGTPMPYNVGPERMVRAGGRSYLVAGGYQGGLRGNDNGAMYLYDEKTRTARPVCFIGSFGYWDWLLAKEQKPLADDLMRAGGPSGMISPLICWTDLNADGLVTGDEIQVRSFTETFTMQNGVKQTVFGFYSWKMAVDMSLDGSWALRIPPPAIRADGTPIYDLAKATFQIPPSMDMCGKEGGGSGVLPTADGGLLQWFRKWKDGRWIWRYPVAPQQQWVPPLYPGQVVQPTREMGPPFTPQRGEAGELLCVNGERGNMFLITTDGLFVQTLAGDMRDHPLLHLPTAKRGMDVSGYSFEDEHFHPTINPAKDGNVYLVAGKEHSSLFRLDGLDSVKRLSLAPVTVTEAVLAKLPETMTLRPRQQQLQQLDVMASETSRMVVDGKLDEWADLDQVEIGSTVKGSLMVGGDRLYACWRTSEAEALRNGVTQSDKAFAFKRGGCVDIHVGPAQRQPGAEPVAGDLRLLATMMKGKPLAMLYRMVGSGTAMEFTSPVGRVTFADVRDVTDQVQLAADGGNVELSVPLSLLGISAKAGSALLGDIGYLRGDGVATVQRSYWNNLDTMMVSDIPTEARLYPANWGEFRFVRMPDGKPLPAQQVDVSALKPGLLRRMWNCTDVKVPREERPDPIATATVAQADLRDIPQRDDYALLFDGYLTVAKSGMHRFTLESDDGSLLWIDGTLLVDSDGVHGSKPESASVALAAGPHRIRVGYLQRGGGASLVLRWKPPGLSEEPVPAAILRH